MGQTSHRMGMGRRLKIQMYLQAASGNLLLAAVARRATYRDFRAVAHAQSQVQV